MSKKTTDRIIEVLTQVYTAEISAVGIYMDQHARMKDQGLNKFADQLEKDAVQEMKHAEALMDRIHYVGGPVKYEKHEVPDVQMNSALDMIKVNIALEERAIKRLSEGIRMCFEDGDHGTRLLLEKILVDEETHLGEYESLRDLVEQYGNNYIVSHMI